MDDAKTAKILMALLKKHSFTDEEKEAVQAAIGILSWTSLAKSRVKTRKNKLEKNAEWQ
jgi:hypothetical protein